ncbi:GNAT family N-acetyltransferase [Shewanella gelidimarina]|uniref:GNAT family N-acetyltransferase n=1 Tax=Shewanella gelidimarina TaxID=56813 RepID=UPI00200DA436|nr:GNAT family N-acetyltransferase [Shewanella gelidimarina]MCL1058973.1 GNAT family N-acetyltransferase [Shewanella gelidimarina]
MEVRLATQNDMPAFFEYLNRQLQENGVDDSPVFQPLSRAQSESQMTDAMKRRFSEGIAREIGQSGWRRMLLAFSEVQGNVVEGETVDAEESKIIGHIDIRPHPESHTEHRALLGMGVDLSVRGKGLGRKLIESIESWTVQNTGLEYIDLWVLSNNLAAIKLYQRSDFIKCGEIIDMFRIDGRALAYSMMCKPLADNQHK